MRAHFPCPAMQLQWPVKITPCLSTATQHFNGVRLMLYECLAYDFRNYKKISLSREEELPLQGECSHWKFFCMLPTVPNHFHTIWKPPGICTLWTIGVCMHCPFQCNSCICRSSGYWRAGDLWHSLTYMDQCHHNSRLLSEYFLLEHQDPLIPNDLILCLKENRFKFYLNFQIHK